MTGEYGGKYEGTARLICLPVTGDGMRQIFMRPSKATVGQSGAAAGHSEATRGQVEATKIGDLSVKLPKNNEKNKK